MNLLRREPTAADPLSQLGHQVWARLQQLLCLLRRGVLRLEASGEDETEEQAGEDAHVAGHEWARRDSNPGPLLCESSALTS